MYTQKSDGATFDGFLYVYTGSAALDPPTFYGGLTLVGANNLTDANGFGRPYGIFLYNAQRVTVRGLRVVCSPRSIVMSAAAYATTDCELERCESLAYGQNGLAIEGTATNSAFRNVARDCKVDAVATRDEDWNWRDKGSINWLPGTQDACVIGKYTDACAFERVVSIDGFHDNFYVGATSGTATGTVNARMTDCASRSPARDYGPCISSGGMGAGNTAYIDRFNGSDCISWIHKTGDGKLLVRDSYFGECKRPYPAYDQTAGGGGEDGLGVNLAPGLDIFAGGTGTTEAGAITATRCSFVNPYGWMIEIFGTYNSVPGQVPAGALNVSDSLFVDLKYIDNPAARTYNPGVLDRAGGSISCREYGGVAGIIVFNNVHYWTGAAGQPRLTLATNQVPPMVTLATYVSGTFSEADPVVDASGYPQIGTPLLAQAQTSGLARDANGMYRDVSSAIGAYEYVKQRTSRARP